MSGWQWADVDVAVPRRRLRLPGVAMAGFRQQAGGTAGDAGIAMVAHPAVTLILDLSETGGIVRDAGGTSGRGSFVAGLLPGRLRTGGREGVCLQIRLSPAVAAAVLPAPELTGTVVTLEDVWGRDAGRTEDRLRAAPTWDERFTIATDVLARCLAAAPRVEAEVARAWHRTRAARGRVRIDGLAEEVGWSRKRLWSRFRAQLGVTPKRAAGLVRFDHAARLLAAGHPAATAAALSGYADQPHLNRETRAITGLTPAELARAPWLAIDDVAWPAASRP
ncbi:AraC-type DNA-binding protein [Amycolatopsis tolypomycina]|uniref:AraC-type DNA-binding protein n=1 Tax=Amycolatopsis tolypomycina TaxID=208445 RepID=A0A1H4ZFB2_9PSEU|nr:helix-turn-helix domain-containing protein [Amycolatopsis tolypomycina]SED28657.1 AraC-type DNA-binding protein [Amycolatopsis tolypomycina]